MTSEKKNIIINLDDHRSHKSLVFAGRERGEAVRKATRLEEIDDSGAKVTIVVPDDVISIASSFFLGMFGPSIRRLGEKEFRARYNFQGIDLDRVIEDGIREALETDNPLS